ncbi:MAG: hypothetical protein A370_04329 [Clostridium sp. Maddingley MBC34-26]|nr:MAG: hypothetical protein A370_04329 [Clostridium sp. Maddingley MBC34-26]
MSNNIKDLNRFLTIIIYSLVIILICLILYNLFLLMNKTYSSNKSPRNSINVGTISVESKN